MPRASQSTAGKISEFFRTASMDVAEFALGHITDILRERRAKSSAAKARAAETKPATAATVAPKAAVKKAAKKKSHKRKPAASPAVEPTLPMEDAGEAGDAPELAGVGAGR